MRPPLKGLTYLNITNRKPETTTSKFLIDDWSINNRNALEQVSSAWYLDSIKALRSGTFVGPMKS